MAVDRRWAKKNRLDLARIVPDGVAHELGRLAGDPYWYRDHYDLDGLVRAIYQALLRRDIRYDDLPPGSGPALAEGVYQDIRPPREILGPEGRGNCLDLTVLFCGLCLDYKLVPLLVLLKGHAFAAVARTLTRDDYKNKRAFKSKAHREEFEVFNREAQLLTDGGWLAHKVAAGDYLVIECTGVARWRPLEGEDPYPEATNRGEDGRMTFEQARQAAEAHLARPFPREFDCILNMAHARDHFGIFPDHARGGAVQSVPASLRVRIDRGTHVDQVRDDLGRADPRPRAYIIHGGWDQARRELAQRLALWELSAGPDRRPLDFCRLAVPRGPRPDRDDDHYRRELAPAFNLEVDSDWPTIFQAMANDPRLIVLQLPFGQQRGLEFAMVQRVLDFWARLAGLARGLTICLCLSYDPGEVRRRGIASVFALGKRPSTSVRKHVEAIGRKDDVAALAVVALDRLDDVSWNQVDEWLDSEAIKKQYGSDREAFRTEVVMALEDLFPQQNELRPMRDVLRVIEQVKLTLSPGND